MEDALCPLCGRPLGRDFNKHHLVPKTFKGRVTIDLHRICHNKIHSVFSERELKQYYHTIERLLENEEIRKFVKWLQNKHADFYESHRDTGTRKGKRRKKK
jgi:hypothetical protein